ncbi:preprotein translocase subunit SecE [Ichthyobacterium seriolicida]|uniref:preprotein translocase subunit SecE n=1 Tax=Ichthyobacterium seriolicida TaxID=242600 RepID=UPI000BBC0B42|nr:preprotein translocase subunit SecE [Ichthyobacterium seriolicida]
MFVNRFVDYIKESYVELKFKTSWPTLEDLQVNVIVVAVSSILFSIMIFLIDKVFNSLISNFFSLL